MSILVPDEIVDAVLNSYRRCYVSNGFWDDFYDSFLGASEEIRVRFSGVNFERQKRIVSSSVNDLIMYARAPESELVEGVLSHIADTHNRHHYNIAPDMYDIWLQTLLDTVEKHDNLCTHELLENWRLCLMPGIRYIISHY